jgi:surface antigen
VTEIRMNRAMRRGAALAIVTIVVLVAGAAQASAQTARALHDAGESRASFASAGGASLGSGQTLSAGQSLTSANGEYRLVMQGDGNLVEYVSGGRALWTSGTQGNSGAWAVMQTDGNLVVYNASGQALWNSRTQGHTGASLSLQDDANLVIYTGSTAVWYNNAVNDQLDAGDTLTAGQFLQSDDRHYEVVMQGDGNLVEYVSGGQALWTSGTQGNSGAWAVMQTDGNLVVYNASGQALWNSRTQGHSGARASLQTDGNFVVYSGTTALWANYAGQHGGGVNDYPSNLASAPKDSVIDPWDFYNRECTSFVAWRLNHNEGISFTNHYKGAHFGDAYTWASAAESLGIPVNGTPTPGSVAVYPSSLAGSGGAGHVAYVLSVNNSAGTVTLEEYNFNVVGGYDQRTQAISALGVQYIHFTS